LIEYVEIDKTARRPGAAVDRNEFANRIEIRSDKSAYIHVAYKARAMT
jgi:hypothetical protein